MPTCIHTKTVFHCNELKMQDIRRFHQAFYEISDKVRQDEFILRYTTQEAPKRGRAVKPNSSRKCMSGKYFIRVKASRGPTLAQICQKTFLSILGIGKDRVKGVCKKSFTTGLSPKENRGGDTRSPKYRKIREEVKAFIDKLQPVDSHYCRRKSTRLYLPTELSISKLWQNYNSAALPEMKVKYDYFRTIFVTDYNISFKTPATDVCSECQLLTLQMKSAHLSSKEKLSAMTQFRVHKLKAAAFKALIQKEGSGVIKFSFDCQKNMVLPKLPDQAAYYSRQLYSYNLTICRGGSKSPQNKQTVTIYNWLEHERPKGCNEIVSALHYHLNHSNLREATTVELYADGCPGQNKNSAMVGMLCYWLQLESPSNIQEVRLTFPVVGHSFLPPDRVFGRIEKKVRRRNVIVDPAEYIELFEEEGTVIRLGSDFPVQNWKHGVSQINKPPSGWHFRLHQCKRIIFKKGKSAVLVRGEPNYKCDIGVFRSLLKKNQKIDDITLSTLPNGVPLKPEKLKDIDKLLSKRFGKGWQSNKDLILYSGLMKEEHAENEDFAEQPDEGENECDYEEDIELRI